MPDELTEAVRDWEQKTKDRARANKDAKDAASEANAAKLRVDELLEDREQEGTKVDGNLVSRYLFPHFNIVDRKAFTKWAAEQDETYFEPEARINTDVFQPKMKDLWDNDQPLPPGVQVYEEPRISKRKA